MSLYLFLKVISLFFHFSVRNENSSDLNNVKLSVHKEKDLIFNDDVEIKLNNVKKPSVNTTYLKKLLFSIEKIDFTKKYFE